MKKKPSRHFFRILNVLFLLFITIYIAMNFGYYESRMSDKAKLTEDNIKRFENDVKEGRTIDINSYIVEEEKDYSNSVTKAGNAVSQTVSTFMTDGLNGIFDILKKLFW